MADDQSRNPQDISPPEEELLDRLIRMAQQDSPAQPSTNTNPPSNAPPAGEASMGGSLLGGLLSNPALLSALPQLMSSLGPLLGGGGQKSAQPSPASQPQEGDSPSAAPQPKAGIPLDRHTALLCAIKPYLGKDRQAAAEYMIQMCRVLSTLQGMGISIPSLMASMPKHQGESAMGSQED